ncbi:MAG: permease [Patescibacteria group bacterium]
MFKERNYLLKNIAAPIGASLFVLTMLISVDRGFDYSLPNTLQDFITLSLSIFIEALPFIVLGALLATIVNRYVPVHKIQSMLPQNGFLRRGAISLFGFVMPVCECGNVPLSRSLIARGFKPSEALAFLLAAPVINPVTIWATWAAFSYDTSIVYSRVLLTLAIAAIISYIVSLKQNENDLLTKSFAAACDADHVHQEHRSFGRDFTSEAYLMLRMLAVGAIIAGLVQTLVPRELLVDIGSNAVLSVVAMLALAFVVSICANVDAFFALSFAGTFGAGSIVSFLVFGPMIDIKMLTLLKTTFTRELLAVVSILALILSAVGGLVVTYAY